MNKDKNFLLFAGETYYAKGGMHDFCEAFESSAEAIEVGERLLNTGWDTDWYHVFNVSKMEIVFRSETQGYGVD